MMRDLTIISMHEKGFPMADLYVGFGEIDHYEFEEISPVPDAFFTMKTCNTLQEAFDKAKAKWPKAVIVYATEEEEDNV